VGEAPLRESWLRRTFIHARGVGRELERSLWASGVTDWESFRAAPSIRGVGPARRQAILDEIARSEERLARGDARYFAELLSAGEAWRLWPDFRSRTAFLDIETDGGPPGRAVTLVGVYAGGRAELFARGVNLDDLPAALEPFDVWVTYNGLRFDEPYLREEFGERIRPSAHIDLMYGLRAVGLRGGLKAIEQELGVPRPEALRGLDGWDAVRLWGEYMSGRTNSLRVLAEYNLQDVLNLEPLLAECAARHARNRGMPFMNVESAASPQVRSSAAARALERLGALGGFW